MSCRRLTLRLISNCQRQSGFLLSSIKPQPQLLICSQQARDFYLASSFPTTASAAAATVSAASAAESAERWQLFASVIVERPRIVTKPMSDFDNDYRLMIEDFEHEKSIKSNHEMRVEQDIRNQERKRKGLEVLNEPLQTGLEYEEEREKLHASFTPASQTSGTEDLLSVNRLLDEKLYLIVPNLLDPGNDWFLPTASVEGKSSLREAVNEALVKTFGGAEAVDRIQVMGNAPFGFYKYRYPLKSEASKDHRGGKFFIFKAFLKDPRTSSTQIADGQKYAWLTKAEMKERLHPTLNSKVQQCLFDY